MKILILVSLLVTILTIDLPYQAHSFNDFDYFVQLLKKGIITFKMDISMVARQSCQKHSSWSSSLNECQYFKEYTQEICCLGFRGDASSTPVFNYDFQTTYDFIALLNNKQLQPLLKKKIFIAINFQYTDSMNNMTKSFLYNLVKTIKDNKLGVTIATGTDNIILDYDYKCNTKGLTCDAIEQEISNSDIVLQSSSYEPYHPHDFKKRYRNFNVYYKEVENYCRNGFPAWVDLYDYPLIFWEPSSEDAIQYVANTFLNPNCKRPQKHNNISSFAIACNLDPEMFQIYFQNFDKEQGLGKKRLLQNSRNLLISNIKADKQYLIVAFKDINTAVNKVQILNLDYSVVSQMTSAYEIVKVKGDGETFLIVTNTSSKSFQYSFYDSKLNQVNTFETEPFLAFTYHANNLFYLKKVGEGNFYNWGITDGKSTKLSGCNINFTPVDIAFDDIWYVVGTKDNTNYISYNFTQEGLLSFGTGPTISVFDNNLYITYTDGMCQSAVLANNNQMNKCTFYKNDEFKSLSSVKSLGGMISGSIDDFIANVNSTQPITACHPKLFATKLLNGDGITHAVLFNRQVFIGYRYVGISSQPLISSLFCGASNFNNYKGEHTVIGSFETNPPLKKQQQEVQ